jgi:acyl carrier protein
MFDIQHPISFSEFQNFLAEILDVDATQLRPDAYFITDLGVDSVYMVEIMLSFEHIGLDVAPELAWQLHTVDDAYIFYREQIENKGMGTLGS